MTKIKTFFLRLWNWLKNDGKTTAAAVIYASVDTLMALPELHEMEPRDIVKRFVRILAITSIGILARDRKPGVPPEKLVTPAPEEKKNGNS